MRKDNFTARQDEMLGSLSFLASGLQKLRVIHIDTVQRTLTKWQESNIAAIEKNNLTVPTVMDWSNYLGDFWQRSILFYDTLRQRADNMLTYQAQDYPLIIKFEYEVLIDGHNLPEPCNSSLLKINPLQGQIIDDKLQPIVVIDPRGGHGAGIGGFKKDSEIGESLRAGHPTYFISFTHSPVEGQTLETVTKTQVRFIEDVIRRHPDAEKPVIIGNCQAGWSTMLLAAYNPDLPGIIIINGAPLSYWSGIAGQNPMRYAGGLLGGAWITRFASDFGNGRFDGAWLVSNFENLDPANTLWGKNYNLFSKIDTESERFLDFENWWSNPVLYNSNEIEVIVDDLFIGNRPSRPEFGANQLIQRVQSPIVVFCSEGDNITPPQQALNWIIDAYPNDIDLKKAGKTIIYLQHKSIGHLGIFVSGKIARREHRQLIASLDAVKVLPPGLFEMIIQDIEDTAGNIISHKVFFESRNIADLKVEDADGRIDEKVFPLVDRISQNHSNLYEILVRPFMRQVMTEPVAEFIRDSNTFRASRDFFSSINPLFSWLPGVANTIKANRHAVAEDNPVLVWQGLISDNIISFLNTYRDARDAMGEAAFFNIYGSLTALTDFRDQHSLADTKNEPSALTKNIENALTQGGIKEACIRILLLLSHKSSAIDRDGLTRLIQHYREIKSYHSDLDPEAVREAVTLQNLLVYSYPAESLHTLAQLLPDLETRNDLLSIIEQEEILLINTNDETKKVWAKINDILLGKDITPSPSNQKLSKKEVISAPVSESKPEITLPAKIKKTTTKKASEKETSKPIKSKTKK